MRFRIAREGPLGRWRIDGIGPYVAVACAIAIGWHLVERYGLHSPAANVPLMGVLALGGTPFVVKLLYGAFRLRFGSDLLAGLSIVVSVVLGEYLAGTVILLMLSGGAALEQFAMKRASGVLNALAKRMLRERIAGLPRRSKMLRSTRSA